MSIDRSPSPGFIDQLTELISAPIPYRGMDLLALDWLFHHQYYSGCQCVRCLLVDRIVERNRSLTKFLTRPKGGQQ